MSRRCQAAKEIGAAFILVAVSVMLGILLNLVRKTPVEWHFHSTGIKGGHYGNADLLPNLRTLDQMRVVVGMTSVAVIDARSPGFFAMGHIPGSTNLARSILGKNPKVWKANAAQLLNRKHPYGCVVYCSDEDCTDSTAVAEQLIALGWENVSIFKGGWAEWKRNNLPVEKEQ